MVECSCSLGRILYRLSGRDLSCPFFNKMNNDKNLVNKIHESYSLLLESYLPKDLFEKSKQKKIKILSVGCGKLREAKNLFEYFSSTLENIKLYGIEIDEKLFSELKQDDFVKQNPDRIFLKAGDASRIENYSEWISDGLFDLIIIRHPEITFNTDVFMNIFSICKDLLLDSGYMFITTHFQNEKDALKLLFNLLKYNVLIEVENIHSPSMEIDGKPQFSDKFLLITRKMS